MNLSEARRWQKFLPTPKFPMFSSKSTTKNNFMFLRLILEEKSNAVTEMTFWYAIRFSPHIAVLGPKWAPKSPYVNSIMSGFDRLKTVKCLFFLFYN